MIKKNYHTHTARCMHAEGSDEDYVLAAARGGFSVLGFSDHAPWPFETGYVSSIRMPMGELDGYLASVKALREKYRGTVEIHLGLEAEYFPRYTDYLKSLRDKGIEYLILGHHYNNSEEYDPYIGFECQTDDGVKRYADNAAEGLMTGMFCYLAHPDLFMRHRTNDEFNAACEYATDVLCQAALEAHKPIEYNLLGFDLQRHGKNRGYPCSLFWERARKYHNTVILGVDAHQPQSLADTTLWDEGRQAVLDMGYELTDDIGL